uniref:Uncharacterized protein n=1 Tax=Steinernema glaseri TaxID=37863 RepID=A0A1I7YQW1_9BILA
MDACVTISEFERSRGYAIEKDSYVQSLKEIALSPQAEQTNTLESADERTELSHGARAAKLQSCKKRSCLETEDESPTSFDRTASSDPVDNLAREKRCTSMISLHGSEVR